jgi:hypothetical protein
MHSVRSTLNEDGRRRSVVVGVESRLGCRQLHGRRSGADRAAEGLAGAVDADLDQALEVAQLQGQRVGHHGELLRRAWASEAKRTMVTLQPSSVIPVVVPDPQDAVSRPYILLIRRYRVMSGRTLPAKMAPSPTAAPTNNRIFISQASLSPPSG